MLKNARPVKREGLQSFMFKNFNSNFKKIYLYLLFNDSVIINYNFNIN